MKNLYVLLLGAMLSTSLLAESINIQPFYVSHSKGSFFLEDAMSENSNLTKNFNFLMYLGYTYADDPLVVIDDSSNTRLGIEAKKQHLVNFGFGFHITRNFYLGVGSYVANAEIRPNTTANFDRDTSIGDVRLIGKWRIMQGKTSALALIPELVVNTGSEEDLSTDDSLGGGLRLAWEKKLGSWADLYFNLGYLRTSKAEYKNIRMHSRGWMGVGIWIPFSRKFSINAEWQGQLAFPTDDNQNPTEFYGGLRYAFSETVALFAGVQTTGFGEDISTDFKATAALKFTPQRKKVVAPVIVPEVVEPQPIKEIEEKLELAEQINFKYNSHELTNESLGLCSQIAQAITNHINNVASVSVEGHTDHVGPAAYNQALSERRANSVKECLVSQNIPADMLNVAGYGESRPRVPGLDKESARINRRVEIKAEYK